MSETPLHLTPFTFHEPANDGLEVVEEVGNILHTHATEGFRYDNSVGLLLGDGEVSSRVARWLLQRPNLEGVSGRLKCLAGKKRIEALFGHFYIDPLM